MSSDSPKPAPNRAQHRDPDKVYSPARRRYVSINDAAQYLGVSTRTIRTMIADGRLCAYRMGRRFIRLDLDQIDAAMIPTGGGAR